MSDLHESEIARNKSEKIKTDAEVELMHEKFKLEKEKLYWGFIVALVGTIIGIYTANKSFDAQLEAKDKEIAAKKLELCLKDKSLPWCQP